MKVKLNFPKPNKGLTHTLVLVSDAINSEKSWEEIKDLLRLKLCNANIHTYTSHFMDIQQQEKESLAAYVHIFKTEANQWKFTNDTATIRIFVKGLKNAHCLATHIYEKGPQTLTDAISEVEKLNTPQQLTATIIPPSTANAMSNEGDCCFQCQEPGHITPHCPHIRSYEPQHITRHTKVTIPDWVLRHHCEDQDRPSWSDHSPTTKGTEAWFTVKNIKVKREDPHTDYYSSDDHSSDSGEEWDPLN